ncbi:hypothetical protein GSI_12641 [Ganoderma sinense ZZ0214-1]|uniref:Uncharacterized protein n=1 Tax=Ganoderma sinense ZZ0214-1 TaxID=1077348 RepID=A0A2G8RTA8_9APHY|nr:hypothetical protein GSI_12641 [Ganoderma sinense ZZ0214-1]
MPTRAPRSHVPGGRRAFRATHPLPNLSLCLRLPPSSLAWSPDPSRDVPRSHPTLPVRDAPGFPNNWCGCRAEHLPSCTPVMLRAAHAGEHSPVLALALVRRWLRRSVPWQHLLPLTLPARLPHLRIPSISGPRGGALCARMHA